MYWIRLIHFGVVTSEQWVHSLSEATEACKGEDDFIVFQDDEDISQDIKEHLVLEKCLLMY